MFGSFWTKNKNDIFKDLGEFLSAITDDIEAEVVRTNGVIIDGQKYLMKHFDDKIALYKDGALHCHNGPAVKYKDTTIQDEYWLEGKRVTKEDVDAYSRLKDENTFVKIEIEGISYKLTTKKYKELNEWVKTNSVK